MFRVFIKLNFVKVIWNKITFYLQIQSEPFHQIQSQIFCSINLIVNISILLHYQIIVQQFFKLAFIALIIGYSFLKSSIKKNLVSPELDSSKTAPRTPSRKCTGESCCLVYVDLKHNKWFEYKYDASDLELTRFSRSLSSA
jgi:hypothetical protein